MKFITAILLGTLVSAVSLAAPASQAPIHKLRSTPVNGGINPAYSALLVEGIVTVNNGCMSAKLEQTQNNSTIELYAVTYNASPGSFCTMALKDVKVSRTVRFSNATRVVVLNANGKKELVLNEGINNQDPVLVDTWVRSAWMTYENDRVYLSAELFEGSNPCTAEGVKVGWKETVTEQGRTVIVPHRTQTEPRICTREYNPQFHVMTTEITSPISSTSLAHYGRLDVTQSLKALTPVIQSIRNGGFCRGRCPKTILSLTRNRELASITLTYEGGFDAEPSVSRKLIKKIDKKELQQVLFQTIWLQPGELVDENEGQPICMDAPFTHYNVFNYWYQPIKIGKNENCHQFRLTQPTAKKLIEYIQTAGN